jgi:signal transduction histidine kinase/CheY-like chemotaxis protein/HPt (histidine-containing phosphotransfer) domain-containing protein
MIDNTSHGFPTKLLGVAILLTLAVVVWLGGNSFYIHHFLTHNVAKDQEIATLADEILYLDSVYATTARQRFVIGDNETEKHDEAVLGSQIDSKINQLPDKELRRAARAADDASDNLVALDRKYYALVQKKRIQEAEQLLYSKEYRQFSQERLDGRRELSEKVRMASRQNLLSLEHNIYASLLAIACVIVTILIAWYVAFRSLHRWRQELEETRLRERKAREIAEFANAAKSDFLANMSHELRTPLNSILGMNRLVQESALAAEQRELLEAISVSSMNLLEIVNDILDLSKIEAKEVQLEHVSFDITYTFSSVIHVLENSAKEKGLRIITIYEKNKFPYVVGDPLRMTRILTNLISNAIKYTDKGHIGFNASCKKIDDRHAEIRCEISDTGIGIPAEKLDHIFEKFVQADTSMTRKYGGTGLGLAITKHLVELMGGKVGVESKAGEGSLFWITIPFEITDELIPEKTHRKNRVLCGTLPLSSAHVLVAEDHLLNQMFIRKILERFGILHFEIVENGAQALKRYQETDWDIILMDCQMPQMSGYDATVEIRHLEKETGKHVKIVAMTANAMSGEKEKCLRCGMDEYVSKPIDIDGLKDILAQWLHFEDIPNKDNHAPSPAPGAQGPLDLSRLQSFTNGDAAMEKEFAGIFIEQSDKILQVLAHEQKNENRKEWSEAAHKFKGGAGSMGADGLRILCDQAQHFDGTMTEQAALFRRIDEEYARIKDYLKKLGLLS